MFKALLKKQLFEMSSFLFGGKSGEKRSKGKVILFSLLFLYSFAAIGFMVYFMMDMLCGPLAEAGYTWLYFSFAGIFALALGIIGSVFTVKSQIYDAKDNELLLSMPVKPSALLLARMVGIYLLTFIFEMLILIPTEVVYIRFTGSFSTIAVFVALLFLLPLFSMVFACLIGWLVAIISSKMKHKSFMTVILSLAFITVYFVVYSQMQKYLSMLVINAGEIGTAIQTVGYPLYQFGLAAEGNYLSLLIFALISTVLFGLVYALLSHSFMKIALAPKNSSAQVSKDISKINGAFVSSSLDSALLKKEFKRYLSSPVYMLNCSLGTVMLIVGAVALFIKREDVSGMLELVNLSLGGIPTALLAGLMLCLLSSMNDLTAPSISLEGRTFWQVKSLPIQASRLFRAKIRLHMVLTVPPLLICAAAVVYVLELNMIAALAAGAAALLYTYLCGLFGLFLNLKLPKFEWTNETYAVKQSASVLIALFANWGFILVSFGIYMLFGEILGEIGTAAVCAFVYFAACSGISIYLKRNGEKILLSL